MNNCIVQTKRLTKAFNGVEVISVCSMQVEKGSIYGFLGANGAGKTTVFKLLSGLLMPTMGTVQVLGMDVTKNRNEVLSKIGTLIETPAFYEHLPAEENLKIHLAYMVKEDSDIASALAKVGLRDTGNLPVSKFSLGMRQRLAIARAIVHKPELLVLDEPINGLDPMGIKEMRELFLRLKNEEGMTLLVSSHILNEIEHIADTIGIIVRGRVVKKVTLSAIKDEFPNGLEEYFFNIMAGEQNA